MRLCVVGCLTSRVIGGGDELQGIKKGIMELADIVVVNKADKGLFACRFCAVSLVLHCSGHH